MKPGKVTAMDKDSEVEIIKLEIGRSDILSKLASVEKQLAGSVKRSSKRQGLLAEKMDLLRLLREQKLRITAAKSSSNRITMKNCPISDHAIIRWLERKHDIAVDKLRSLMLADGLIEALRGGQQYWCDGDYYYMIRDGIVVTVLDKYQFWNKQ